MNSNSLASKKCLPCEGGIPPFSKQQVNKYLRLLKKGWKTDGKKIEKEFNFKNFVQSMGFVNQIALIAQAEDHHPEIEILFSKVEIVLWTHSANGLTENDFILASKIDQLYGFKK